MLFGLDVCSVDSLVVSESLIRAILLLGKNANVFLEYAEDLKVAVVGLFEQCFATDSS